MFFKVSSLVVSDYRLYHFFASQKLFVFLLLRKSLSTRTLHNISLNKHKFLSVSRGISKMSENQISESVFQGKGDRFEGITVFSEQEPCAIGDFQEKLDNSLIIWRNNKKRAIWFKVHLTQSPWVPILVQNGFKYHHAKEDYVMLYFWLPNGESHNIPHYAHTMIGVGAVVVNDRDELLVVQEKYFYKVPMWKLPGGYVEPGENLVDAAIREVSEETGIEAKFESMISLRHTHFGMFGCSDIYFVVGLKALTENITKCTREIAECKWMNIEEYLNSSNIHELNKFVVRKMLHHKKLNIKIDCHHGIHQIIDKPYTIYTVVKDGESDLPENKPQDGPFALMGETNKSS